MPSRNYTFWYIGRNVLIMFNLALLETKNSTKIYNLGKMSPLNAWQITGEPLKRFQMQHRCLHLANRMIMNPRYGGYPGEFGNLRFKLNKNFPTRDELKMLL